MIKTNLEKWNSRISGWVCVSGEDAASYLQSQFSNDLRGSAERPCTYGLFLSLKGRVRADAFICQTGPERFEVVSYNCPSKELCSLLEENVIADEVDFTVREIGTTFVVAAETLPVIPDASLIFPGRRMRESHFDVVFSSGSTTIPDKELEHIRVKDGIPSVPFDIGYGELPQEAGLESVAISFEKGCYLGQEVMARLKAMGRVQRHLYHVSGFSNTPTSLAGINCNGQPAGEIRSVISDECAGKWYGLALIRRRFAESDSSPKWTLENGNTLEVGEFTGDE